MAKFIFNYIDIYCFEVWENTILVFPCDRVAVLHPNERSEQFLNTYLTLIHPKSSTNAT